VAGYSRLMGVDEDGTLAGMKAHRSQLIDPAIRDRRGRIVKTTGDGLLVEFASVVDAVQCAVEIQRGMAMRNAGLPTDRRIDFRIGINLGDIIADEGDIFGDGVNVAARLEALAEPGGLCLSGTVREHVGDKLPFDFVDLGERQVKNIARPVRVFAMSAAGVAALPEPAPTAGATPALALPDRPSIAVLPFVNLGGDPEQTYFADGITEDIITELSRFRSLFVIARNSSFAYRGTSVDIRRVGTELGVRFVVEGSVRKSGNRLRLTAQLIEVGSGSHLWAERYDRDIGDLFDVQDELTRTIVSTVAGRLEDADVKGATRRPTGSLPAYDCFLRGIEHLRGYAENDNRLAAEMFERAIAVDPHFALPHAYLAQTLLVVHGFADAPAPIKARALASALTAVRLDPREGRCHWFLAEAYLYRGEFDEAMSHFERSVALNPNDANCIASMGLAVAFVGRADEGIGLIRQAMRLNPHHPDWYWSDLAMALYAARRYEEALEANRRIPYRKSPWHLARLAACYAQLGRVDEARVLAADVLQIKPDFHLTGVTLQYRNPADAEHVFEGMRKAGLPD
jgi:adenylate cyclase